MAATYRGDQSESRVRSYSWTLCNNGIAVAAGLVPLDLAQDRLGYAFRPILRQTHYAAQGGASGEASGNQPGGMSSALYCTLPSWRISELVHPGDAPLGREAEILWTGGLRLFALNRAGTRRFSAVRFASVSVVDV
jgi:hypothetical protein